MLILDSVDFVIDYRFATTSKSHRAPRVESDNS